MEWGRNESIMHTSLQEQQDFILRFGKGIEKKKTWLISTWLNVVFNCTDKKVKTKNTRLLWNKTNVLSCCSLLFPTNHELKTWFDLSRVKLYRNDLKGNKNYFELAREVRHIEGKITCSKCMKEMQGKSTLVRVSTSFELARVRAIRSRPYSISPTRFC